MFTPANETSYVDKHTDTYGHTHAGKTHTNVHGNTQWLHREPHCKQTKNQSQSHLPQLSTAVFTQQYTDKQRDRKNESHTLTHTFEQSLQRSFHPYASFIYSSRNIYPPAIFQVVVGDTNYPPKFIFNAVTLFGLSDGLYCHDSTLQGH